MSTQGQLGQSDPAADTDTVIYTVPATTEVSNMMLTCCNTGGSHDTVTVYQDDGGGDHTEDEMIYSGYPVPPNRTVRLPIGPMSTATGTVSVNSKLGYITFTLNGTVRDTS